DDVLQIGAGLARRIDDAQGELGVPQDRHQQVVEVVRDPPGERSQRLQLLRLAEIGLQLPPLLGLQLAEGDVRDEPRKTGGGATRRAALAKQPAAAVKPAVVVRSGAQPALGVERAVGRQGPLQRLEGGGGVMGVQALAMIGGPARESRIDLGALALADVLDRRQIEKRLAVEAGELGGVDERREALAVLSPEQKLEVL